MTANKKIPCRRCQFLGWTPSWSLFGCFRDFVFKQNAFLSRKLPAKRLKKVHKYRNHGNGLAKKTAAGPLKLINGNKKLEIPNSAVKNNTTGNPTVNFGQKIHRGCKRGKKSSRNVSGLESLPGTLVKTRKPILAPSQIKDIKLKEACRRSPKTPKHLHRSYIFRKTFGILWFRKCCNLLMMPRKPPPFTGRYRLHTHKRGARKSLKILDLWLWLYKRLWKCRKNLKRNFCKVFSYLNLQIRRPIKAINRPYDMNNNASGVLCEIQPRTTNACLRDETVKLLEAPYSNAAANRPILRDSQQSLLCTTTQWSAEDTLHKNNSSVTPSYSDDVCMLLTEKEVSISSQEDGELHGEPDVHSMLLAPDKIKPCTSDYADFLDNTELMENGEDSCAMEVDGNSSSDVYTTKLLDHPYCKSPLQETSLEAGLEASARQCAKNGQKIISNVSDEQLASCICDLLNETMKKYGSLIPLSEKDVFSRLNEAFNEEFSHRASFISKEITKYRVKHSKSTACSFRVLYNKHVLDMDDLTTLDGQNWINDQVINMYGELIMDAVPDKVLFLNSFFHRQLMTKGYNGVKRWTKKVDVFKKVLLLIPIHLEVHWSLITVNIPKKLISFYDSQGIHFKFCVENIRKYLITEAKEKGFPEFLEGWQTAVTKCIPQQKNDSDCGVFVLQYCKCLALDQPFQFSQEDMPRVRKRIYKELCECKLMD